MGNAHSSETDSAELVCMVVFGATLFALFYGADDIVIDCLKKVATEAAVNALSIHLGFSSKAIRIGIYSAMGITILNACKKKYERENLKKKILNLEQNSSVDRFENELTTFSSVKWLEGATGDVKRIEEELKLDSSKLYSVISRNKMGDAHHLLDGLGLDLYINSTNDPLEYMEMKKNVGDVEKLAAILCSRGANKIKSKFSSFLLSSYKHAKRIFPDAIIRKNKLLLSNGNQINLLCSDPILNPLFERDS